MRKPSDRLNTSNAKFEITIQTIVLKIVKKRNVRKYSIYKVIALRYEQAFRLYPDEKMKNII